VSAVAAIRPARISILEAPGAEVVDLAARRPPRRSANLTRRERQVLDELAKGSRTEDMAANLFLSTHTIRTHVKTLLHKLGAHTRAHAVAIAYSEGALDLDS
jgi:DNA-binding CsgD family transcriptional regulator